MSRPFWQCLSIGSLKYPVPPLSQAVKLGDTRSFISFKPINRHPLRILDQREPNHVITRSNRYQLALNGSL